MPSLTNARHEMFAVGLAAGKSQSQAYKDAGYGDGNTVGNASVLAKRPDIRARRDELIAEKLSLRSNFIANADLDHLGAVEAMVESGEVDRAWVMAQLMDNVKQAREAGQFSASNKALELLGAEIGMFQKQTKAPDDAKKQEDAPAAVSVEAINHLLESVGYQGPPIDLTPQIVPAIESKDKKNAKSSRA